VYRESEDVYFNTRQLTVACPSLLSSLRTSAHYRLFINKHYTYL